jgi:hypothetical protein
VEGPASGDLGRAVFLTGQARHARGIDETFSQNALLVGGPMKKVMWLLVFAIGWTWGAGAAHACSCEPISPEAGFDRAQYVFTGKVVKAESHIWFVEIDRAWKGGEKLRHTIMLMDVYARMDCESFFRLGERYVFFTILAKGGRPPFYHPQVCNWTRPLQSARVPGGDNESLWLEDLIIREHGPGEPPSGD